MFKKLIVPALLAAVTVLPSGAARAADDPDFLTLAVGKFDILRNREEDAEIRLDYRFGNKFWIFKPFLTAAYATNNSSFIGAGVLGRRQSRRGIGHAELFHVHGPHQAHVQIGRPPPPPSPSANLGIGAETCGIDGRA